MSHILAATPPTSGRASQVSSPVMGRLRGRTRLACVVAVCAAIVGGVVAALVLTTDDSGSSTRLSTAGEFAPLTVSRPDVPIVGGGIPVDIEALKERKDFGTTLVSLPGKHQYEITFINISDAGVINSFQWYPPTGVHVTKLLRSSRGNCTLTGLTGFGGNQFPGVVLYPNILCEGVDLEPPTCTCLGNGGSVSIAFTTDEAVAVVAADIKLRTATLVFDRIPGFLNAGTTPATTTGSG